RDIVELVIGAAGGRVQTDRRGDRRPRDHLAGQWLERDLLTVGVERGALDLRRAGGAREGLALLDFEPPLDELAGRRVVADPGAVAVDRHAFGRGRTRNPGDRRVAEGRELTQLGPLEPLGIKRDLVPGDDRQTPGRR